MPAAGPMPAPSMTWTIRATTTSSVRIPYTLNSYAGFGEAYYNILNDLKLTGGLRWTDDQKHFVGIPVRCSPRVMAMSSPTLWIRSGRSGRGALRQTGRRNSTSLTRRWSTAVSPTVIKPVAPIRRVRCSPCSKAGTVPSVTHPLTFAPEFINAYEPWHKEHAAGWRAHLQWRPSFSTTTKATRFQRSSIAHRSI